MFCPQCGSTQSDDLKYCKSCGANLLALRQIMSSRGVDDKDNFDWSKTWVAEMFMSREEIDRKKGITPEIKRLNEIKAGLITGSAGIGLMILLFVLMQGIVLGGGVSDVAAAILLRLWVVGVIPIFVGAALIINGMFVSKRGIKATDPEDNSKTNQIDHASPDFLPPAKTNDLTSDVFSVTEETTKHLRVQK